MRPGGPRSTSGSAGTAGSPSSAPGRRAAAMAGHPRVYASTTTGRRSPRPSWVRSSPESQAHTRFGRSGRGRTRDPASGHGRPRSGRRRAAPLAPPRGAGGARGSEVSPPAARLRIGSSGVRSATTRPRARGRAVSRSELLRPLGPAGPHVALPGAPAVADRPVAGARPGATSVTVSPRPSAVPRPPAARVDGLPGAVRRRAVSPAGLPSRRSVPARPTRGPIAWRQATAAPRSARRAAPCDGRSGRARTGSLASRATA